MASAWIALFVFLGEYKLPTDDFVVNVMVMYLGSVKYFTIFSAIVACRAAFL